MNSTSHMPYLHSKLFPTILCQCKFKCNHQKAVAWVGILHIKIKLKNGNITQVSIQHILPHMN
jgi:hypothetical protein